MTEANYETAFKGLAELVAISGTDELKAVAKDLGQMIDKNQQTKEAEDLKRANEPDISQEDFKNMSYTERLKMSVEFPDIYNKLVEGGK